MQPNITQFCKNIISRTEVNATCPPFVWTAPNCNGTDPTDGMDSFRGLGGERFEVWGEDVTFHFNTKTGDLAIFGKGGRYAKFQRRKDLRGPFIKYLKPTKSDDLVMVRMFGQREAIFVFFDEPTQIPEGRYYSKEAIQQLVVASNNRKIKAVAEAPFVYTLVDSVKNPNRVEIWANLANVVKRENVVTIMDEHKNMIRLEHSVDDAGISKVSSTYTETRLGGYMEGVVSFLPEFSTECTRLFFPKLEGSKDAREARGW